VGWLIRRGPAKKSDTRPGWWRWAEGGYSGIVEETRLMGEMFKPGWNRNLAAIRDWGNPKMTTIVLYKGVAGGGRAKRRRSVSGGDSGEQRGVAVVLYRERVGPRMVVAGSVISSRAQANTTLVEIFRDRCHNVAGLSDSGAICGVGFADLRDARARVIVRRELSG